MTLLTRTSPRSITAPLCTMLMLMLVLFTFAPTANAQTGVFVTTQDFVSLRTGPQRTFDRYGVVPPTTTLPAVARSADMQWIQVDYQGQLGWISARYLVWSGDIIQLPIDGFGREAFIRRTVASGMTTRPTPYYRNGIDPRAQAGIIPEETLVEIVGRLGDGGRFWLLVNWDDGVYWVGSWNIRQTGGSYDNLPDAGYRYPYGRLVIQLSRDIANAIERLADIERLWVRLQAGENVQCGALPDYLVRASNDNDIAREPEFAPIVGALDTAQTDINAAISRFEDICLLPDDQEIVTQRDINDALNQLEVARRNVTLAVALLNALDNYNPLLDERETEFSG